jgi:colanic acid biosynthesis glycosyl transferase WcaI
MRVLLLSLHFAPDTVSNALVATELAEELAARGHDVTVVAAMPYHQGHQIETGYRGQMWQRDWHGPIRVYRTWLLLRGAKGNVAGRFLAYGSFNLSSTLIAAWTGPQDVVITPSPPLTIGVCGWLLARRWGARFIYNVQDIYPDAAVRLGLLRSSRTIRFFTALERFVYAHADAVTVLSEGFRQNLLAKRVPEHKLVVIPNGVDTSFITPGPRDNAFAREHGLVDRFVALYAGNVGMAQGVETLLETAREPTVDAVDFLVVGSGAASDDLRAVAHEYPNLRCLPFQPRARVPDVYASADVGLVLLRAGLGHTSVPSKVYSIMAAAKPVAASVDPGSEVWQLVERAGCGECVPAGDAAALGRALEKLRSDQAYRETLGRRGRSYVERFHSRRVVGDRYDALLSNLRPR